LGAIHLWPSSDANGFILVPGVIMILAALVRQFTLLDENRRLLETVGRLALLDPLTGLANRTLFSERLAEAVSARRLTGGPVAVLLLDVDEFKLVNDSLGHPAGDGLLRGVGERIRLNAGADDTVARIGGDEFAVLVRDTPEAAARTARQISNALDEPIVIDGQPLHVRVSLGLAAASGMEDADVSADELLRRADLAMYSAKRSDADGVQAYEPTMRHEPWELSSRQRLGRRDTAPARTQLLAELRQAIESRRLQLVYQPKVSLATNEVVGVEALLRWPHPRFGLLEPGDFLPLVRENDLIDEVTNVVLPLAIADAAGWYAEGLTIPVAVNLSTPSLNDESLPDHVAAVLDAHAMSADSLLIEITEDVLLASVVRARTVLDRLRHNGVRVAIDDFGSGFATMKYLRDLPVDELKIDQQFVTPMLEDNRCATIVRSIIELADSFEITSVAEGVEDAGTASLLRDYGCDVVQGHYFSPPVPASSIRPGIWGTMPSGRDDGEGRVGPIEHGEDRLQSVRVAGDLQSG
jgi:diguanylate cyclase (GGDEF)-like protein